MTIQEAIRILKSEQRQWVFANTDNNNAAVNLGIEALKQIKWLHESQVLHDDELLSGETKE